jgi:hypothetical protein
MYLDQSGQVRQTRTLHVYDRRAEELGRAASDRVGCWLSGRGQPELMACADTEAVSANGERVGSRADGAMWVS